MSTISVINVKHPSSASNNLVTDSSGNTTAAGTVAMGSSFLRNRIINGAMVIDQRNAGASVAATNGGYALDRWRAELSGGGAFSIQQSTTAPTGFANSSFITVTTADASIASTDYYDYQQFIEGYNVADLGWGTSAAQTVTLSFWVRSSVTGTFAGSLVNSAANRSYVFTYAISASNTWEQKSVTIPGDTSGTWLTTSGRGIAVSFDLGNGSSYQGTAGSWLSTYAVGTSTSVKLISTLSATWYITGVQLEVGTVATPFERRLYGTELALCQRYYISAPLPSIVFNINQYSSANFPVTMRASPTVTVTPTGGVISAITPSTNGFYALSNSTVGASFTASIEL
jgi:hypothetical protein